MTNRIRDASKKSEVGRPKTEDRTRHGPSTRGDPDIRGKPLDNYIRGKPPFIKCADTKMREYINVPIRGKPPLGVGVYNSNITDLESSAPGSVILSEVEGSISNEVGIYNMRLLSCFLRSPLGGKPEGKGARNWLHRKSRVLAAKKPDDEVGVFIPNGDSFAEKEEEEAPPNLPQGEEQEKRTSV